MILCNYWPFISRPLPRAVPENAARRQQPHSKQCVDCSVVLFFCSAAALHCATVYIVPKNEAEKQLPAIDGYHFPGAFPGTVLCARTALTATPRAAIPTPWRSTCLFRSRRKSRLTRGTSGDPGGAPRQSAATKMAFPNDSHCSNRRFDLATLVLHQSVQSVNQKAVLCRAFARDREASACE